MNIKGEVPVACVVMENGSGSSEEEMRAELLAIVREEIGPLSALRKAMIVKMVPKMRPEWFCSVFQLIFMLDQSQIVT